MLFCLILYSTVWLRRDEQLFCRTLTKSSQSEWSELVAVSTLFTLKTLGQENDNLSKKDTQIR